jgi:hypothetical protein
MKTIEILIAVFLIFLGLGRAADTNVIYLPVERRAAMGESAKLRQLEELTKRAQGLPECRPAELDPAGHWGPVSGGLQLSARVFTNVFTAGKPINLILILRNTATNGVALPGTGLIMFDLLVFNQYNEPLTRTNRAILGCYSGPAETGLPGRRQIKYEVNLGGIFDLNTPGKYTVYAKRRRPKEQGPDILSGAVPIDIIGGPKSGPTR